MPTRELSESGPRILLLNRKPHTENELSGLQIGFEQSPKEVFRLDRPVAF